MAKVTTGRNDALWKAVLPQVVIWLRENPLATAAQAGRKFNLPPGTLSNRLRFYYPGEFDFFERRRQRGAASGRPRNKDAKVAASQAVDIRKELNAILDSLARIEGALARQGFAVQKEVEQGALALEDAREAARQ